MNPMLARLVDDLTYERYGPAPMQELRPRPTPMGRWPQDTPQTIAARQAVLLEMDNETGD